MSNSRNNRADRWEWWWAAPLWVRLVADLAIIVTLMQVCAFLVSRRGIGY
jgi:hypothetical protein